MGLEAFALIQARAPRSRERGRGAVWKVSRGSTDMRWPPVGMRARQVSWESTCLVIWLEWLVEAGAGAGQQ